MALTLKLDIAPKKAPDTFNTPKYPSVPAPRATPLPSTPQPDSIGSNPDASIVPALNPDHRNTTPLEKLQSSDETFRERLQNGQITPDEVAILCQDLEATGKAGGTIPDFASKVGLLTEELDNLRSQHPKIDRSMRVARGLRKKMLGELTLSHAVRHPTAIKELLTNEAFSKDLISDEEESEIESLKKSVDRRAEEILLANGIEPCQYTQVIYLVGDTTTKVSETPLSMRDYKELNFLEAKDILHETFKHHHSKEKTSDLGGTTGHSVQPDKRPQGGKSHPRLQISFPRNAGPQTPAKENP